MNLEKVHYLLTAIECGTFSLAAEKLGMTQSGLNRQISSLETELKTTLLLRGRRGVVPAKGAEPIIARLRDSPSAPISAFRQPGCRSSSSSFPMLIQPSRFQRLKAQMPNSSSG